MHHEDQDNGVEVQAGQVGGIQFRAVPRSEIPTSLGSAASFHVQGFIDWIVDEAEVDERILDPLAATGDEATSLLIPRASPRQDGRWGQLVVGREDISIAEMKDWKITESGLYFPVPRGLITENLAAEISAIGTDQLKQFDPNFNRP